MKTTTLTALALGTSALLAIGAPVFAATSEATDNSEVDVIYDENTDGQSVDCFYEANASYTLCQKSSADSESSASALGPRL
jgi:hypothetical protein